MWQPMTMLEFCWPYPYFSPLWRPLGPFLSWTGMESWIPGSRRCGKFDTFLNSFFNPFLSTRCVTDTRWWSSWTACWWCAGSRGSAGPTVTPTTPGLRHRVSYNRWGKNGRLLQKNSQSLQNETRNLRWKPFFCNRECGPAAAVWGARWWWQGATCPARGPCPPRRSGPAGGAGGGGSPSHQVKDRFIL